MTEDDRCTDPAVVVFYLIPRCGRIDLQIALPLRMGEFPVEIRRCGQRSDWE